MSDADSVAVREATVPNTDGLHLRPVSRFVELASTFTSTISVRNVSGSAETVDGKSAMQMPLLDATQGCVLRIEARGTDAPEAVDKLASLVEAGFDLESHQDPGQPDSQG